MERRDDRDEWNEEMIEIRCGRIERTGDTYWDVFMSVISYPAWNRRV